MVASTHLRYLESQKLEKGNFPVDYEVTCVVVVA